MKKFKQREFGTSEVPMEMSEERMRGMMADPDDLANREPFDRAFIDTMIPHHQSAIEMAEVALEESRVPGIRELATEIVRAQREEIEQMRQWREEWYLEG